MANLKECDVCGKQREDKIFFSLRPTDEEKEARQWIYVSTSSGHWDVCSPLCLGKSMAVRFAIVLPALAAVRKGPMEKLKINPAALMEATKAFFADLKSQSLGKEKLEQLGYGVYWERDWDKLNPDNDAMTKEIQIHLLKATKAAIIEYDRIEREAHESAHNEPPQGDNGGAKREEGESKDKVVDAEVVADSRPRTRVETDGKPNTDE